MSVDTNQKKSIILILVETENRKQERLGSSQIKMFSSLSENCMRIDYYELCPSNEI